MTDLSNTDTLQGIREDLSFLRSISGGSGPEHARRSGRILVAAGVCYATATLVTYAAARGFVPAAVSSWSWAAATVVFLGALFLSLRSKTRDAPIRDRASGLAWGAVGGSIFAVILGFTAIAYTARSGEVFAGVPTVILALYGAAWLVASGMSGAGWMRIVSFGAYAAAVLIGFLVKSPREMLLAYAGALTLFATLPGVYLLTRKA